MVGFQSFFTGLAADVKNRGSGIGTCPPGKCVDSLPVEFIVLVFIFDYDFSRSWENELPYSEAEFGWEFGEESEVLKLRFGVHGLWILVVRGP